jgi:hypothetical protein
LEIIEDLELDLDFMFYTITVNLTINGFPVDNYITDGVFDTVTVISHDRLGSLVGSGEVMEDGAIRFMRPAGDYTYFEVELRKGNSRFIYPIAESVELTDHLEINKDLNLVTAHVELFKQVGEEVEAIPADENDPLRSRGDLIFLTQGYPSAYISWDLEPGDELQNPLHIAPGTYYVRFDADYRTTSFAFDQYRKLGCVEVVE